MKIKFYFILILFAQACTLDQSKSLKDKLESKYIKINEVRLTEETQMVEIDTKIDSQMWHNERFFVLVVLHKTGPELKKYNAKQIVFKNNKSIKNISRAYIDTFENFYAHLSPCEKSQLECVCEFPPEFVSELNSISQICFDRLVKMKEVNESNKFYCDFIYLATNQKNKTVQKILSGILFSLEYTNSKYLLNKNIRRYFQNITKC